MAAQHIHYLLTKSTRLLQTVRVSYGWGHSQGECCKRTPGPAYLMNSICSPSILSSEPTPYAACSLLTAKTFSSVWEPMDLHPIIEKIVLLTSATASQDSAI